MSKYDLNYRKRIYTTLLRGPWKTSDSIFCSVDKNEESKITCSDQNLQKFFSELQSVLIKNLPKRYYKMAIFMDTEIFEFGDIVERRYELAFQVRKGKFRPWRTLTYYTVSQSEAKSSVGELSTNADLNKLFKDIRDKLRYNYPQVGGRDLQTALFIDPLD